MVHDNPYLEVWRTLPLDQTELNIFCKWSRFNQIEKWSSLIMVSHNLSKILSSPFVVIDDKGGEVIHKDRGQEVSLSKGIN